MQEAFIAIFIAVVGGLTLLLIKSFLKTQIISKIDVVFSSVTQLRNDLDDHIEECEKVPKILILEKIENLAAKIHENHEMNRIMRSEILEELKLQRARNHELQNLLTKLTLSRNEELK